MVFDELDPREALRQLMARNTVSEGLPSEVPAGG
jgi:hypothetical protein